MRATPGQRVSASCVTSQESDPDEWTRFFAINLFVRGLQESDIARIMGGNLAGVMKFAA
jgi:hypothetical protein